MSKISLEELKLQKAVLEHALEKNLINMEAFELTIEKLELYEVENLKKRRKKFIDIQKKIIQKDVYNLLLSQK